MALGCSLTSVRANRGENYENEPLVHQKHIKKEIETKLRNESGDHVGSFDDKTGDKNLKQVYLNIFLDMDTDTFYILEKVQDPNKKE
jgi:hypothetical protein